MELPSPERQRRLWKRRGRGDVKCLGIPLQASIQSNPVPSFLFILAGKRNDDESAKEKLYTYATPILGITDFHGLQTTVVDQE